MKSNLSFMRFHQNGKPSMVLTLNGAAVVAALALGVAFGVVLSDRVGLLEKLLRIFQ